MSRALVTVVAVTVSFYSTDAASAGVGAVSASVHRRGLPAELFAAGCGTRLSDRDTGSRMVRQTITRPVFSGMEETVASGDGRFLFHYTRSGVDAVRDVDSDPQNGIPDYVDDVMEGIRRAHQAWVVDGGWPAPPGDAGGGGDDRIDIYIKQITCEEASGVTSCGPGDTVPSFLFGIARSWTRVDDPTHSRWSSFITVNPSNDIPLGRNFAKSVAAHEYHHVIQFGMDTAEPRWVYESTAAYLQLVLFRILDETPYVVDALLQARLLQPELSLYTREGRVEYSNALWFRYLVDRFGQDDIVLRAWERAATDTTQGLYDAFDALLTPHGSNFESAFVEWGEWNYFICGRDDGRHYRSGSLCTTPTKSVRVAARHDAYPVVDATVATAPEPLGMSYVELVPDGQGKDVVVDFAGEGATPWALSVLKVANDCSTSSEAVTVGSDGRASYRVADIHDYKVVAIQTTNLRRTGTTASTYRYSARTEGTYSGAPPATTVTQTKLTIYPAASLTLANVGDTANLSAVASLDDCTSVNATRRPNGAWWSLHPTVADVSGSGLVEAKSPGKATIRFSYGGQQADVEVQVGALTQPPKPPGGGCSAGGEGAGPLWLLLALGFVAWRSRRFLQSAQE